MPAQRDKAVVGQRPIAELKHLAKHTLAVHRSAPAAVSQTRSELFNRVTPASPMSRYALSADASGAGSIDVVASSTI